MKKIISTCFLLVFEFAFVIKVNAQGCSQLNFKEEAEISSTCANMVMTMMHDALGKPYLYVANKEAGLKIYDISKLDKPSLVKTIPITSMGSLDVMNLSQEGDYVYLALGNHFSNNQSSGMAIIDVDTPGIASVKDFWVLPSSTGGAGIIKTEGNYAYLGAMKNGLAILDISDKSDIKFLSQLIPDINYPTKNPNPDLYNARGMEVKNGIVYLCYDAGGIRIINTSNKSKPLESGHYSNPALNGFPRAYNNVILDDSLLYVAVDYCGLEVLNIKDTSKIKLRGRWNPYNCPTNNWFASPVHANEIQYNKNCRQLFLSTGKSDMMVLDVSNPASPDSCNFYGGVGNNIGTWGVGLYQDQIYLSYICAIIPFQSNWTGVKILSYSPYNVSARNMDHKSISLYPNPAKNSLSIQSDLDLEKAQIHITNSVGQLVNYSFLPLTKNQFSIDLSGHDAGVYFIRFTIDNRFYTYKFLREPGGEN